jgi:hypothetical protein
MLTTILLRATVATPVIAVFVATLDEHPPPNETGLHRLTLAAFCSFIIAALGTLWEASGGWSS